VKVVFRGSVSKNKLVMSTDFTDHLFTLEGCDIDLTVEKHKKQRSNNQNAYFHCVIVKGISDKTGYTKEETKEILRMLFISYELKVGDKIIKVGRSTASLTTSEFEELNSECREWASQTLDLYLCEPNEVEQ